MEFVKNYLYKRGINQDVIDIFKLGYGKFYGTYWITIPILDINRENCLTIKLRKDPRDDKNKVKYIAYPRGMGAQIYGLNVLRDNTHIVITEGEMDKLVATSYGIPAITTTTGAGGFKKEFVKYFGKHIEKVHICLDADNAGRKNAQQIADLLKEETSIPFVYIVNLPKEGQDLTDYFTKDNGNLDDLFEKYSSLAKSETYEIKWEQVYRQNVNIKGGVSETDILNAQRVDCSKFVKIIKKLTEVEYALCPFHNEKTPSFACYKGERGYFCFGCKESGNAITLAMKLHNLKFPEAVKYVLSNI